MNANDLAKKQMAAAAAGADDSKGLDAGAASAALGSVAAVSSASSAADEAKAAESVSLAKVVVNKEFADLLVAELEISAEEARMLLRRTDNDIARVLREFVHGRA